MVFAPEKGYLIDSSALIQLLGGKNPRAPMGFLTNLAKSGRLRVPAAVLREIEAQDDKLRSWARRHEDLLAVPETEEILSYHDYVIQQYGRFFTTSASAADPMVVCTAMYFRDSRPERWDVVVNDDGIGVALNRESIFGLGAREFRMDAGF